VPLDSFDREIDYLRISVMDRCNLRCTYCMPLEGLRFLPPAELLTAAEIGTVVRAAVDVGFRKFRLTGGEPTLRRDLVDIVARIRDVEGVGELAMTTNAILLPELAGPLVRAGLDRVNIHLDTLDEKRLRQVMRLGDLDRIRAGIAAAEEHGLTPIKLNSVVVRGENDADVVDLARLTIDRGWHVRFIELMPLGQGESARYSRERYIPNREVRARLEAALGPLEELPPKHRSDESRNYRFAGAEGVVGFISPVSEPFCGTCNRMRLSADGRFLLCLLREEERDVRAALRGGGGLERVREILRRAVGDKPVGHELVRGRTTLARRMHQIGG
jgi:cyclic pyranopterin phosphate synthase